MGNPCPEHLSPLPLRTKSPLGRTRAEQTCCVPFSTASATALLGEPHTRARVRNRPAVSLFNCKCNRATRGAPHARTRAEQTCCVPFNCKCNRATRGAPHARTRAEQTCCVPFFNCKRKRLPLGSSHAQPWANPLPEHFSRPPSGAKGIVGGLTHRAKAP